MSDGEGTGGFPEHDRVPGGEPPSEVPTGAADATALPSEAVPTARDAGSAMTPDAPAPAPAETAATGVGSLAGTPAVGAVPGDTPPASASVGEAGAAGWAAPSAPAKSGRGRIVWIVVGLIVLAGAIGGVVFRDRISGSSGDLVVGDCFDAPSTANALGALPDEVGDVQHHPCSEAHLYETFAVLKHPAEKGAPYPGIQVLFAYAETNCLAPFEAYVGVAYDASSLSAGSIVPKEEGWKNGQRSITCYLNNRPETPVTGTLKGSKQ